VDNTALLNLLLIGPKTGVELAEQLGISRAAVWKRIEYLRVQGLEITALKHTGYVLMHTTPLLCSADIRALLSTEQNRQIKLHIDFATDSTQQHALAHNTQAQGLHVWLAESQTAGQGRRGKIWQSPPLCNIYCSVNRRFYGSIADLSGFSLATAVMLVESLQTFSSAALRLKWPNDIYLQGKKCAGLLIQVRGEASGPCDVTLGFGINVLMSERAGHAIDQAWTSLAKHSTQTLDRNKIAAKILGDLLVGFELYQVQGLSAFIDRWRALDELLDRPIFLTTGQVCINGIARGIDENGALLVEHDAKINRYHSGDVSVRVA
jgi:BirA family biotin operon repressor/biotin-[acetyl-CoA-carboxylase] ligase